MFQVRILKTGEIKNMSQKMLVLLMYKNRWILYKYHIKEIKEVQIITAIITQAITASNIIHLLKMVS